MDLPINEILFGLTEGEKVSLTPEQMELLVARLTSVDDIPSKDSKIQTLPFDPAFITKSGLEFTLGDVTTHYRELQFHDSLRIAQVIPQAIIYLFGVSVEKIAQTHDPVELAYTVFFKSLTDGIGGKLTEFTEAILELFCVLISNENHRFHISDVIYAKGIEPIKVFKGLVSVNVDFFAELPQLLPENILKNITFLGGSITSTIAPIINLWSIAKEGSTQK